MSTTERKPLGEIHPNSLLLGRNYTIITPPPKAYKGSEFVSHATNWRRKAHVGYNPTTGEYEGLDEAVQSVFNIPAASTECNVSRISNASSPKTARVCFANSPITRKRSTKREQQKLNASSRSLVSIAARGIFARTIMWSKRHFKKKGEGIPSVLDATGVPYCDLSTTTRPSLHLARMKRTDVSLTGLRHNGRGAGWVLITRPTDFQRELHVTLAPGTPAGFAGLPRAWEIVLTRDEQGFSSDRSCLKLVREVSGDDGRCVGFLAGDPLRLFESPVLVGVGAWGEVFRARDPTRGGRTVAVKRVPAARAADRDALLFEKETMQAARHANVVWCDAAYAAGPNVYLVMDFADAGSLTGLLRALRRAGAALAEPEIAYVLRELLQGLERIHELRRVHRDIKSDNVFLTSAGGVLLGDFGLAAQLTVRRPRRDSAIGTTMWMAPEMLSEDSYDCRADVWAAGIVAIECADGLPPHFGLSNDTAADLIVNSAPPRLRQSHLWSGEFTDFIKHCTMKDPWKRPSAGQMLCHPFLRCAEGKAHMTVLFSHLARIVDEERRAKQLQC